MFQVTLLCKKIYPLIFSNLIFLHYRYETTWRPQAVLSPRGRVTGSFQEFAGTPAYLW